MLVMLAASTFLRASSTSVVSVTGGEACGTLLVGVGCWMLTVLPVTCTEVECLVGMEGPPPAGILLPLGTVVAVTIPRGRAGDDAKFTKICMWLSFCINNENNMVTPKIY